MLFLILVCSLISVSTAGSHHFRQLKVHGDSNELLEYRAVLSSCDDDLDYEDAWLSMGIGRRKTGEGTYEINPETETEVARLLEGYDGLTIRQVVDLAKELRPELARDIENYIVVTTRPVLVFLESAVTELAKKINCFISGACKTFVPKEVAIKVLETGAEKIVDFFQRLGEQTSDSYKVVFESIDKDLNLKCNYECVERKYSQWCSKRNQPSTIGASPQWPTTYPPTEKKL